MDTFDLKKFLIENKLTETRLVHRNTGMANPKLKIGSIITPKMWDKQKFYDNNMIASSVYDKIIKDSYRIIDIFFDEDPEDGDTWLVNLKSVDAGKNFGIIGEPEELDILNNLLKDPYEIVTYD